MYPCPLCQLKCQSVKSLAEHLMQKCDDQNAASGQVINHMVDFYGAKIVHMEEEEEVIKVLVKLYIKLMEKMPRSFRRKRIEKSVVEWKKDEEDKSCENCGSAYGLFQRRHHCRLCGSIRCSECCRFMTLDKTHSLVCRHDSSCKGVILTYEIRMCTKCEKRVRRHLDGETVPVRLYNRMHHNMEKTNNLRLNFVKITKLLWSGECSLSLREVLTLQKEFHTHLRAVRSASEELYDSVTEKLARKLRDFVVNYLQQQTLPYLPTPKELAQIKQRQCIKSVGRLFPPRCSQARFKVITANCSVNAEGIV